MSSSASCLCISILVLLLYAPAYSQPFGIDCSSLLTMSNLLSELGQDNVLLVSRRLTAPNGETALLVRF
jgi:hypothetical protein